MAEKDQDAHSNSDYGGFVVHEPQPYVPSNPIHENDIERLLSLESESTKGWVKVKKTKEAQVWRREAGENCQPCITKAILHLEGVPFKKAVNLMTDWKIRKEWDKTTTIVDVLDRIGNFKVVYNCLKMPLFCTKRDVVLASLERYDPEQRCYILALCSTDHPSLRDSPNPSHIRAETLMSGTIIRPFDDGYDSSTVTVITQMKLNGSAPDFVQKNYLAERPIKRMQMLKKYYHKHGLSDDRKFSQISSAGSMTLRVPASPRYSSKASIEKVVD